MKRLGAIFLVLLLAAPAFACTTAVVSAGASKSGRPMLWKQRDASDKYNIMVNVTGGRYAYTGLFPTADTLHRKCYAGINEAGFAIMNNLSYNLCPDDSTALKARSGVLMAVALAECRTLEDFEGLLRSPEKPLPQSANYGVIDALGGAAYYEVSDTAFVRYDVPEDGILFRTNFSLSGDPERGRGFERYDTMEVLTEPPGMFNPAFFLNTGRSYLRTGRDVLAGARSLEETGFIPRSTTVSSVVIEGAAKEGERGVLWCATGYTPCCYAVAAVQGAPLPEILQGPANLAAAELYGRVHPSGDKQLDCKALRRIIRIVKRFERGEAWHARRMIRKIGTAGEEAAVLKYNEGADRRFLKFKKRLKI